MVKKILTLGVWVLVLALPGLVHLHKWILLFKYFQKWPDSEVFQYKAFSKPFTLRFSVVFFHAK